MIKYHFGIVAPSTYHVSEGLVFDRIIGKEEFTDAVEANKYYDVQLRAINTHAVINDSAIRLILARAEEGQKPELMRNEIFEGECIHQWYVAYKGEHGGFITQVVPNITYYSFIELNRNKPLVVQAIAPTLDELKDQLQESFDSYINK